MKATRLTPNMVRPMIPRRSPDANKSDFGHVLLVAGSRDLCGAALLAAHGALRGGAGLVTVAVPESCRVSLHAELPEALALPLPEDSDGRITENAVPLLEKYCRERPISTVVLGPGLGRSAGIQRVVQYFFQAWKQPLILDADGINSIHLTDLPTNRPWIITPHEGEMSRLTNIPIEVVHRDRNETAERVAHTYHLICLLKGRNTLITDGALTYINPTGNVAMATGGMGDVLSGLLGALCAQGASVLEAACVGAYVHGLAGDLAAVSDRGLFARELANNIPNAFKKLGVRA